MKATNKRPKKPAKRAPRAALSLVPTVRRIHDGHDAYVSPVVLRDLTKTASRYWTFHDMPTTVELPGQRYAKSLAPFSDHQDEERFLELVREYAENGSPRPSGYADVFHNSFASPRVPWSVNVLLAPALAGGWQEALQPGIHSGEFYKYDMRSAYLWAGSLGMPDVTTYRRSITFRADVPGVYRVKLAHPVEGAPFPFNRSYECLATNEEIEVYGLPVVEIVAGVTWKRLTDPEKMLQAVRRVSTWKQAGRSYWGRWGQTSRVQCTAGAKTWALPNVSANIPWAATIIARVKMRAWEFSTGAVHVFVDSLITPHKLPTGDAIGDWKLERTYPQGVIIKAAGQYTGLGDRRVEKLAGVPKNSPLRDLLADKWQELLAG